MKLLLNIRIILPSNKIQLLQKQFINYFVKNMRETTEFGFPYFTSSLKTLGNMYSSLANQIVYIFTC